MHFYPAWSIGLVVNRHSATIPRQEKLSTDSDIIWKERKLSNPLDLSLFSRYNSRAKAHRKFSTGWLSTARGLKRSCAFFTGMEGACIADKRLAAMNYVGRWML